MSVEETGSLKLFEGKQQEITRQELVERVSEHVNRILRRNLYELKLDEKQTFRLLRQKEELRRYLKEAGTRKFTGKRVFDFFYSGISVKRNEDG